MTTPTVEQLGTTRERAEAGMAWLDLEHSGWWKTTDLKRLDLGSPIWCPAAQAQGSYLALEISVDEAIVMGLDVPQAAEEFDPERDLDEWERRMKEDYAELTDVWRELIEQRRAEWTGAA